MLKQGSIGQLRRGEISRKHGWIVIAMCHYPRGIRREWRHEYRSDLAPDRKLFRDWKAFERKSGHNAAFVKSRYEKRFHLSAPALEKLSELARRSHEENIYLLCQCELGDRCHREMLLLLARKELGAHTAMIYHEYPAFERRIQRCLLRAA